MTKDFCDICGKAIEGSGRASRFKLKKEAFSWHEHWWENLHIHDTCWHDMCKYIRERRTESNAVSLVRCKNCKYLVRTAEGEYNPSDCVCSYWNSDGLKADDFCSCGEEGVYEPTA